MGIEAWAPLRPIERAAMRRAWKVAAISTHTVARFRAANPSFADIPVAAVPLELPPWPAPERIDGPYGLIVGRMARDDATRGTICCSTSGARSLPPCPAPRCESSATATIARGSNRRLRASASPVR